MHFQSSAVLARAARAVSPISLLLTSMTLALASVGSAAAADIPPVYQQSQSESARQVVVREFVIEGVTAEDMLARLPELNALVERERQRHLGMDTLDSTDFDDAERSRILAFMQRVAQSNSEDASVDEYRQLVEELRQTSSHRAAGLTINQINAVARSVTDYFRAHGYFLARAVIPAQDVNGGSVTIQVFEGRFGDVVVEGNSSYSDEGIQSVFEDAMGEVITPESIEAALVSLQDMPGLEASTSWQPGSEVGSSDLLVSVTDEDRFSGYALVDNHLADTTGATRVLLGLSINNVTSRMGDTLSFGVIQTVNPSNDTFGHVNWRLPLNPTDSITLGWGQDTFDVGGEFAILDINGRSTFARVAYNHQVRRSFAQNLSYSFDFATQRARISVGDTIVNEDKISVFGAQLNYDSVSSARDVVKSGWIRLDFGIPNFLGAYSQADAVEADILGRPTTRQGVDDSGVIFATSSFNKLSWDYQSASRVGNSFELTFRMQGQASVNVLPSMHTFTMGGPGSVRGLPAGSFQMDTALVGSLDLGYRPGGWAGAPVFSLFYDQGLGYVNDPLLAADRERSFGSFGWGVRYAINDWFIRLMSARMHEGRQHILFADPLADADEQQYWLDLGRSF